MVSGAGVARVVGAGRQLGRRAAARHLPLQARAHLREVARPVALGHDDALQLRRAEPLPAHRQRPQLGGAHVADAQLVGRGGGVDPRRLEGRVLVAAVQHAREAGSGSGSGSGSGEG